MVCLHSLHVYSLYLLLDVHIFPFLANYRHIVIFFSHEGSQSLNQLVIHCIFLSLVLKRKDVQKQVFDVSNRLNFALRQNKWNFDQ